MKWAWTLRLGISVYVCRMPQREFDSDPARPNPPSRSHSLRSRKDSAARQGFSRAERLYATLSSALHGNLACPDHRSCRDRDEHTESYLASASVETAAEGRI
jgi:hypothetical protein